MKSKLQSPTKVTKANHVIKTHDSTERLAHSLIAPIKALRNLMVKQRGQALPYDQRKLLALAVDRLSTISTQYLRTSPSTATSSRGGVSLSAFKSILLGTLFECQTLRDLGSGGQVPEIVFYNFTNLQNASKRAPTSLRISEADLKYVLFTLIESALDDFEASDLKPLIRITCYLEDTELKLEIQNNGKGLELSPFTHLPATFRTPARNERDGLDMYFATQTIRRWGGTIEFQSKLDHGTTVFIGIPVSGSILH